MFSGASGRRMELVTQQQCKNGWLPRVAVRLRAGHQPQMNERKKSHRASQEDPLSGKQSIPPCCGDEPLFMMDAVLEFTSHAPGWRGGWGVGGGFVFVFFFTCDLCVRGGEVLLALQFDVIQDDHLFLRRERSIHLCLGRTETDPCDEDMGIER